MLAVERGAQDFLLKSRVDNYILPKTLRSMVERAEVTLNSIGDAVISTDEWCNVTYLKPSPNT